VQNRRFAAGCAKEIESFEGGVIKKYPHRTLTLVRAHDHVWADREWPLEIRIEACKKLWNLVIENHKEQIMENENGNKVEKNGNG
jgi:hypothetical protein